MRRYILVFLIFSLASCSLGQKRARPSPGAPTNAPAQTTPSSTPVPAGTRVARSAPTKGAVPLTAGPAAPVPSRLPARRPLGVYAHLDISDFIEAQQKPKHSLTPAQLTGQLDSLYEGLLANPAISGLAIGVHWVLVNPDPPTSPNAYDWGYLDDAFNQVTMWNAQNPARPPKTLQLIVDAGFDSPPWLLNQIPSCDGLFASPPQDPAANCGKATFTGYAERAEGDVFPLPWNPTYKAAWQVFLTALAARYGSNPAFVSIAVGGPTAASTEMILPSDGYAANPQTQFGAGISPDDMWLKLLAFAYPNQPNYQNSDQAFIDEWGNAIDLYGKIFSGITLVVSPDTGGFPDYGANFTIPSAFTAYCPSPDMDCAAKAMILSHFTDPAAGGANAKSTQTGGMRAYLKPGENFGVAGVKRLSAMTASLPPAAQILGGEQYDHPFSSDAQEEGCATRKCTDPITPEQAEYNVLRVFFDGTPAAAAFGGTPGSASLNYLQDNYEDIQYATAHANAPVQIVQADGSTMTTTAQELLNLAGQSLLQIAERGQTP
ncbi:MAG TPA: hypothetical protein VLZ89_14775 [Anaerolineales bacterium]|nr:hypothetical protein [Anaerolineales bacterium]